MSSTPDLNAVDLFAGGNGEVVSLPAFDIDVPVRKLEIVVSAGKSGTVVDSGPRRLIDSVDTLPHPFLEILRIGKFHLADASHGRGQQWRARAIPPEAMEPCLAAPDLRHWNNGIRLLLLRKRHNCRG